MSYLLKVLLKDVCDISDNTFALQIRKKIYIFFSMFYFRAFIFYVYHCMLFLLATFQDNTDQFSAIHHMNNMILTYYWQRCIITEKRGFAFKYYWQVGCIHDKSDEMRVGLLTEIFWGRQVCSNRFYSLIHSHFATVCSQVLIYTAEWTGASWRERKCPIFEMVAKGIRTRSLLIASPAFYRWATNFW